MPSPEDNENKAQEASEDFARLAEKHQRGLIREFIGQMAENKKWWLLPIILALLMAGMVVLLGNSVIAPLIYTLF